VSLFTRQSYQNGVAFLAHNFGTLGITLDYGVFDFGKRHVAVRKREAESAQAQENVERLKEEVSMQINRTCNKVERTKKMLQLAAREVKLRAELPHLLARVESDQTIGPTPGL
jgi:outer membrane protein TolC